jgi:L-ascorbate metabolism protein UlaG (beta-lactamase superfamily)
MKLTWLGHSGFRLGTGKAVLLIDPWLSGNPMLPETDHDAATEGATHILLSHAHFDHVADVLALARHLNIPIVGQYDLMGYWGEAEGVETIGFNKGGTVRLGDTKVSMVAASHSSTFSTKDGLRAAGSEVGFMISAEGRTIYFSGDTDVMADMLWPIWSGWRISTNPTLASCRQAVILPWGWKVLLTPRGAISTSKP